MGTILLLTQSFGHTESRLDINVGDIQQSSSGSHIYSEINIGSSLAEKTGNLDIGVSVDDVWAKTNGSGNRSTINIGSVKDRDTTGFKTRIVINGKVIVDNDGSDGEVNIGSQISR
jgi:hypothetical protein